MAVRGCAYREVGCRTSSESSARTSSESTTTASSAAERHDLCARLCRGKSLIALGCTSRARVVSDGRCGSMRSIIRGPRNFVVGIEFRARLSAPAFCGEKSKVATPRGFAVML